MRKFNTKSVETFTVDIYIAGDIETIDQVCQGYCDEIGLCVSVTETMFIYTGGQEKGARVGLINYPRFPNTPLCIENVAFHLAEELLKACDQDSCSMVMPDETILVWDPERKDVEE